MLLQNVLKEFQFEIQIKNYTQRTIKGYKNNNNLFINYLKNEFSLLELEEVMHLHIKQYVKFLSQQGRKGYNTGIYK